MHGPWTFVAISCLTLFAAATANLAFSPLVVDISQSLATPLWLVAKLFVFFLVAASLGAYLAGRLIDRWGQRTVIVGATITLACALLGASVSQSYMQLAGWMAVAGFSSNASITAILMEISVRVPVRQRGRAIGIALLGYSLTGLIGIPSAAWLGAVFGWRGVPVVISVLCVALAIAIYLVTRPGEGAGHTNTARHTRPVSLKVALTPPVLRLLGSLMGERICHGLVIFFYPSHLQIVHRLTLESTALPLLIYAVGLVLGTLLGGQFADRFVNRRLVMVLALMICGAIGLVWFLRHTAAHITVGISFCYALSLGTLRPLITAELAKVPETIRGTVMGLNGTLGTVGLLAAIFLGGWVYALTGFKGFGPVIALVTLASSATIVCGQRGVRRSSRD